MFLDAQKMERLERLDQCVEDIRRRFGKGSIRNAVLLQNLQFATERAELTMPTGMIG